MIDVHLAYEATGTVENDRYETHGPPEETFARIAAMWSGYLDMWLEPTDVAQLLVLLKIARSRYVYERDHYVDQIGYTLIAESLNKSWYESK